MFEKVFNVWVLIVLFIYDLWIMFPLIGNVLSVENIFDPYRFKCLSIYSV